VGSSQSPTQASSVTTAQASCARENDEPEQFTLKFCRQTPASSFPTTSLGFLRRQNTHRTPPQTCQALPRARRESSRAPRPGKHPKTQHPSATPPAKAPGRERRSTNTETLRDFFFFRRAVHVLQVCASRC